VHRHGGVAENWPKYRPQTACTRSQLVTVSDQVFDKVGKSFPNYKPGTNWCTKYKVKTDKKFKEHGKCTPWKRKTCNKQKDADDPRKEQCHEKVDPERGLSVETPGINVYSVSPDTKKINCVET